MSCVATQTEERRRLVEQVIRHSAVRIVTNRTILSDRGMFVCEWPLFLGMALVAHHVDGGLFEVAFRLPVSIVAIGALHLAFLNRMVRRHGVFGVDVGMALVTHLGIINCHRQSRLTVDMCMLNANDRLHMRVGMRIVAIGTGHAVSGVRG